MPVILKMEDFFKKPTKANAINLQLNSFLNIFNTTLIQLISGQCSLFYTPWKYQKTHRISAFRVYRKENIGHGKVKKANNSTECDQMWFHKTAMVQRDTMPPYKLYQCIWSIRCELVGLFLFTLKRLSSSLFSKADAIAGDNNSNFNVALY